MTRLELVDRLRKLNLTNAVIERETGFPKNNLGKCLKNPELFSERWITSLMQYLEEKELPPDKFEREIEEYLNKPENVEYRRKILRQFEADFITFNVGIIKEEKGAAVKVINPLSEEGQKVIGISNEITALEAKIKAIRAEKLPDHIKTSLGIRSWNFDQNKRVKAIEQQIEILKQLS
jgi:hypothetical protein